MVVFGSQNVSSNEIHGTNKDSGSGSIIHNIQNVFYL